MSDQNRDAAHIASLSAIIEMQKRLVVMLDGVQNRGAETTQAIERVSRKLTKLHEDQVSMTADLGAVRQDINSVRQDLHLFRTEVAGRFEAVGERFDEVENALDSIRADIRDARTEIVAQNLETLNAVQEAANVRVTVNELSESVDQLRTQLR